MGFDDRAYIHPLLNGLFMSLSVFCLASVFLLSGLDTFIILGLGLFFHVCLHLLLPFSISLPSVPSPHLSPQTPLIPQTPTNRPPQCFLTIPALVYQTAISTFPRTRQFANPYAFAAVDASFLILWFSAAIAVGAWVNEGIAAGQKKENSKDAGCEKFGYGSVKKCDLSQVQIGLGVMIMYVFPCHVGGRGASELPNPPAAQSAKGGAGFKGTMMRHHC